MSKAANKRRAARARVALDAYGAQIGVEDCIATNFTDLLADMCHLADTMGLDLTVEFRKAHAHYDTEKKV